MLHSILFFYKNARQAPCFPNTFLLLLFVFIGQHHLVAQTVIPEGSNLLDEKRLRYMVSSKEDIGEIKLSESDSDSLVLAFHTYQQPKFIYSLARAIPTNGKSIPARRRVLFAFRAKTVKASLETGEAKVLCILRQSGNHQDNLAKTVSIGADWRTYYLPYETTKAISADELRMVLQFGFPPQTFLVRDIQLLTFGPEVSMDDLPRTRITYPGQDPDAEWRQAALRRIERQRKGTFSLQFTDEVGTPLAHQNIQIEQLRHNFGWGAAVSSRKILSSPEHLQHIREAFNLVVFENDLKIKRWQNQESAQETLAAIDILANYEIETKGHVLIWPGFRYLPPQIRQWQDDPERVTKFIADHVADVLRATEGKISRWDVVNEAYTNRDLQDITGSEDILANGFRYLHQQQPNVLRYTNEFGIISRGGHDTRKQEWYYDYIRRLDEQTGGLIDGIGIQSHMGSDLTPPERVLEILDYYAQLDKKISISEFTIDIDDAETRYDYTRDFIIAAFSHPAVYEFLFWGYYEPDHPKANIYSKDWQLGEMGYAFFSLVHDLWKTRLAAATDDTGRVQGRGFYGTYRYSVQVDGTTHQGTFELLPGQPLITAITLAK